MGVNGSEPRGGVTAGRHALTPASSSVVRALNGRRLLLTGATGFLGKVVLAILLDRVPGLKVVCLVRAADDQAARDRFLKDVLASPVLDALRAKHGLELREFVEGRVEVKAGDLARDRLGLEEKDLDALGSDLDLVIHCAGLVDFVPALDKALAANVEGTLRVFEVAKRSKKGCAFVHVSTCYVAGEVDGPVQEELDPLRTPSSVRTGYDAFDPKKELDWARALVKRIVERSDDAAAQAEHWDEAGGNARKAKRLAETMSKRDLVLEGLERSKRWGWPNIYTYTKSLAERLLWARKDEVARLTIVRPSVIESAIESPFPGWNQGINTSAPLIWMASRGTRLWPSTPDHYLDVIPVDHVANALIFIGAAAVERKSEAVYQLGTSDRNPLAMRRIIEMTSLKYREADLPESWVQKFLRRHVEPMDVPAVYYEAFGIPALGKAARAARKLIDFLPRPKSAPRVADAIEAAARAAKNAERQLEKADQLVQIYLPFINGKKVTFRCDRARGLFAALPPDDRAAFPYAPEAIDWRDYWMNIHCPGLERWTFPELKEREGSSAEAAPLYASLVEMIDDVATRHAKRVALRRLGEGGEDVEKLTYDDLSKRIVAGAAKLFQEGVRAGDRVALVSENAPSWVVSYFAILRAGATAVPIDASIDAARVSVLLRASGAKVVLLSKARDEALGAALAKEQGSWKKLQTETLGAGAKGNERAPDVTFGRHAASLIYTSGTTGAPKGVLLSHEAFAHQVRALTGLFPLGGEDRVLSVLPLHHAFEFTAGMLLPLAKGSSISYLRETSAEAVREGLHKVKPTSMIGVPALFESWHRQVRRGARARGPKAERAFDALAALHRGFRARTGLNAGSRLFPQVHQQLGGELRYAVSGGAALPREVTQFFYGLGIDVYEGYGLTEAAPVVCANAPGEPPEPGSVGRPIPAVEVKIEAPDGEGTGEVLVRTPSVMDGYDQDERATNAAIQDGWLRTGDLGRLDPDGRLQIVGRSKEVIVDAAGNTVYPDEVEDIYQGCADVQELAVAGVALRDGKEVVGCMVLPRTDAAGDAAQTRERIQKFFRERGEAHPYPKRVKVLRFTTRALPRTATRKVKRDEVARMLAELARSEAPAGAGASGTRRRDRTSTSVVTRVLTDVGGVDPDAVVPEADLAHDLGLDSIALADVAAALADATGRLPPRDLERFQTVADLIARFEPATRDAAATETAPSGPWPTPVEADPRPIVLPEPLRVAGRSLVDTVYAVAYSKYLSVEVTGEGNIPHNTRAIVIANHASHLDVGLVQHALGDWGKELAAVGARDYFFKNRAAATYFENFTDVVPFDRRASIRESLERVKELLEQGRSVLVFPEGTRSLTGRLGPFKAGLGHLVAATRTGILPIYLAGAFDAMPKGSFLPRRKKLEARIGSFLKAEALLAKVESLPRRERPERIAEIARDAVVSLRDRVAFDLASIPASVAEPPPVKPVEPPPPAPPPPHPPKTRAPRAEIT